MTTEEREFQNQKNSRGLDRDIWSVFRIMGELVEGYNKLFQIGPCISIFGSARTTSENEYYQLAVETAHKITQKGFGVITGGGPGIMEAANKGAEQAKGKSVGLGINLPFEQGINQHVDPDFMINFNYFFVRKVMFVKYAQGFVVFPGGFGTMDELFESLTLVQTRTIDNIPIILFGSSYWNGLIEWMEDTMKKWGTISDNDTDLFHITDSTDEVVDIICDFYSIKEPMPNFYF